MKAVATFPTAIRVAPTLDARTIGETTAGKVYHYAAGDVRFVERARWYRIEPGRKHPAGWVVAQTGRVINMRKVRG